MPSISLSSAKRCEMIDITSRIDDLVPPGLAEGLCHVFSVHTTAGITVNENADPDVVRDILAALGRLVPASDGAYRHAEGNSDSHIKASLVGVSQTVPVRNGRLDMGTWQGVYFCEFDGPRHRTVRVDFVKLQQSNRR